MCCINRSRAFFEIFQFNILQQPCYLTMKIFKDEQVIHCVQKVGIAFLKTTQLKLDVQIPTRFSHSSEEVSITERSGCDQIVVCGVCDQLREFKFVLSKHLVLQSKAFMSSLNREPDRK